MAAAAAFTVPKPGLKHLILVGLPGAGKTTVGRAAAAALGCPFLDLDEEIERQVGAHVTDIFAERGEEAFRELERDATRRLADAPPSVVAPGGGWMTVPDTVALARPVGCIIYLKVTPETAMTRLGASYRARPLLVADPEGAIERLYRGRRAAYEAADRVVDTEALTLQEVTNLIVALARAAHTR